MKGFWRKAGEIWCAKMYNNQEEKVKLEAMFQAIVIQHLNEIMRNNTTESTREDGIRSTVETASIFSNIFGSWYKQEQKGI